MNHVPTYFKAAEFTCRCGSCGGRPRVDRDLIMFLDLVRAAYGQPIKITSGWRCTEHNKAVGGALNSRHMYGRAADFTGANIDTLWVLALRLSKLHCFDVAEIIKGQNYIHVAF